MASEEQHWTSNEGKGKRKLDEGLDEHLNQASTSKRLRADHMEVNFSMMSFPQKLWYIVDNETYGSIRWHQWGMCVILDVELFEGKILSQQWGLEDL
ncbi:hypothetical protein NFI96_027177 [Prochilodus magdalenae]|nr:hypothetical protein NFI96_027177 [Prochilodus magdalenae]